MQLLFTNNTNPIVHIQIRPISAYGRACRAKLFPISGIKLNFPGPTGNGHWLPSTLATHGGDTCYPDSGYLNKTTLATPKKGQWLPSQIVINIFPFACCLFF